MIKPKYPWQTTPIKLITYAKEHAKKDSSFDHQIAFLLLDVGIEMLFKVYLDNDTDTNLSFGERQKAIKGTFHKLVNGIEQATKDKTSADDLRKVRYFHKIRNKLYHEGDGVSVTTENLEEYCKLAERVLHILFNIEETNQNDLDDFQNHMEEIGTELQISAYVKEVEESLTELRIDSAIAIYIIRPDWSKRSTIDRFKAIWEIYPDDDNEYLNLRVENQSRRIEEFSKITGVDLPVDWDWFVIQSIKDPFILQLYRIAQEKGDSPIETIDRIEVANMFISYATNRRIPTYDNGSIKIRDASPEEIKDKRNEIISWISDIQKWIENLIENDENKV